MVCNEDAPLDPAIADPFATGLLLLEPIHLQVHAHCLVLVPSHYDLSAPCPKAYTAVPFSAPH
eukprot:gene3847-4232_t